MTRRRRSNSSFVIGDGGEFGARTPTEQRATKIITPTTEVKIPRAQAFWMALPLSVAVVVTALSPIALGARIFFAATGVCALAAFLWSLQYEVAWQDRVTLPFLVGIVAWCFWRFADFAGWRAPEAWQPFAALAALASLVFWWAFVAALWLTFVQRLGMPMFPQQYSIWSALGSVLEWKLKREPTTPPVDPLILNRSRRYAAPELQERKPEVVEELSELQLFLMLARELGTLTRGTLAGKHLANDQKLSKNAWARCMQTLDEQGYVENGGSGYGWTLGQSAGTALDAFV